MSECYGIIVEMFHNEHGQPHVHVRYGEYKAIVGIDPIHVLAGRLPVRAERLVGDWASRHQRALLDNWNRARMLKSIAKIKPLD